MNEHDPVAEALAEAEAKLEQLKSRDQLVTDAQKIFAELGSRIHAVIEERRTGGDRRAEPRAHAPERRTSE